LETRELSANPVRKQPFSTASTSHTAGQRCIVRDKGLRLVGKNEKLSPYFRASETVPEDGVYRVFHTDHRLTHEVTLLAGETFPRCNKCGFAAHFELVHPAPHAMNDTSDFRIRLYEIEHPEEEKAGGKPQRVA
jgi:hypothetical protein